MEKVLEDKKIEVFNKIKELEKGDNSDKSLAFDLIGILGNESTNESYENRLLIVEEMIKEHINKRKK